MKYYKMTATRSAPRYEITLNNFVESTKRKPPFEQRKKTGRELAQYAVCPSCLNPIQLIGLMKVGKYSPYGRHAGKDIDGLPKWVYRKYEYCPYAKKGEKREPDENEKLENIDDGVIELYELLKTNFDRVIYILDKYLNIRCSAVFWEKALDQYIKSTGYLYPWLTEVNLPYIFAYIGVQHQRIYKQRVLVGSDIYNALAVYHNVDFIESDNKYAIISNKSKFLNLYFRFTAHKQKAADGETLSESMLFCIDDRDTGETVFEQLVNFDETHFMNVVKKAGSEGNRNTDLLQMAERVMGVIG